ncbi:stage V sporulation protein B [Brevibacillus composti]|uniref:Stage V sporulation protein B n=1 Tax=Brevibacillus composti TaxID=2796470 RepID=A0A7T5JME4_9BACL|nr:stage V sporulation protein B [Brevibacillus composti]QQE73258.1 stage V sporulation protein B [Brevibacillus composti]QUO40339.1 stage V sporulation protein B [Brevibacillus composti]
MRQSFFYGTVILIIAGGVTKLLGFANRIILSRILGAEGIGLYQMVVPLLYFLITLATFGMPLAIAKHVAETEAARDARQARRFLVLALGVTGGISLVISTILFTLSAPLAGLFFTDPRAHVVLLAAIPVIPISSFSMVLRGYFQGKHNMTPTAVSQVVEQVIRMALVVVMTITFMPLGVQYAAAGAVGSILFGEAAGFLYILWQYRRATQKTAAQVWERPLLAAMFESRNSLRKLFHVSLPVTMSKLIGSIAYVMEPMIVPFALVLAGFSTAAATGLYGQFAGMAVPLLLFPTFLTYSLSVSLVPAVAEAAYQKNAPLVHRRIYQAMRITLVIGAPCTVLLFIFAEPLCALLYGNAEVGVLLREMAPFSVFLFFQAPLAAALQGLDFAQVVFRNTLIGAIVKTATMFVFTARPEFGIHGAVIATNIGITLVTLLHIASLIKQIGFTVDLVEMGKIVIAMLAMGYAGSYMSSHLFAEAPVVQLLILSSLASTLLYVLLLVALRILGKQDVRRIPWIGEQLSVFFPRR